MSLIDPFNGPITTGGITPTGAATVNLEGEIADGGNRIDAVVTGSNAAGGIVTFIKTSQFNGCNTTTLTGNFAVAGSGMLLPNFASTGLPGTGTSSSTSLLGAVAVGKGAFTFGSASTFGTPFNVVGRFLVDSLGGLVTDAAAAQSPVKRSLTGTYTVNTDCTGTAQLIDASGLTRNIAFVIVNETPQNVVATQRSELKFVFTDPGIIGGGTASPQ